MTLDFRSDTVTKPSPGMRDAMSSAELGDDVFGDDPTIIELEQKVASMFGKEAALYCPSGTMTNQIAIRVHTRPGDEVICDQRAHIYNYEGGGIAVNSGCSIKLLDGDRGRFTADMVRAAINPDDPHFPKSTLVSLENTCNKGGGVIWELSEISNISDLARDAGLRMHLDGARLFNALVETGSSTAEIGALFDSISICLSKGLGCPIGSMLVGDADFIHQARRVRKVFGGGMRQAGMLAAAGIYALDHQIDRLKEDHALARELGAILTDQRWVDSVMPIETNIVVAQLSPGTDQGALLDSLETHGIRAVPFGAGLIRFVTHMDLPSDTLSRTSERMQRIQL